MWLRWSCLSSNLRGPRGESVSDVTEGGRLNTSSGETVDCLTDPVTRSLKLCHQMLTPYDLADVVDDINYTSASRNQHFTLCKDKEQITIEMQHFE